MEKDNTVRLIVKHHRVKYDIVLREKVTVTVGDSASGKSWLCDLVRTNDAITEIICDRQVFIAPIAVMV